MANKPRILDVTALERNIRKDSMGFMEGMPTGMALFYPENNVVGDGLSARSEERSRMLKQLNGDKPWKRRR